MSSPRQVALLHVGRGRHPIGNSGLPLQKGQCQASWLHRRNTVAIGRENDCSECGIIVFHSSQSCSCLLLPTLHMKITTFFETYSSFSTLNICIISSLPYAYHLMLYINSFDLSIFLFSTKYSHKKGIIRLGFWSIYALTKNIEQKLLERKLATHFKHPFDQRRRMFQHRTTVRWPLLLFVALLRGWSIRIPVQG